MPYQPNGPAVRFGVHAEQWGEDRTRYAVVDHNLDTILAIRTTRQEAESDVLVLNLAGRAGSSSPTGASAVDTPGTRSAGSLGRSPVAVHIPVVPVPGGAGATRT